MPETTDHDQLFKEVIREFFPDFLRLFFADYAAKFDFSQIEWLDKELFAAPPDGPKHILDLVAQLRATEPINSNSKPNEPQSWIALIHIEIESADSATDIERRLSDYFRQLRASYKQPILPIVLFLKVGFEGLGTRDVVEYFFDTEVNRIRYHYVGLPGLKAEDFIDGENVLGVALSALMKMPRERIVELGAEAMKRIGEASIPDRKKELLGDCVETYIEVPPDEIETFRGILNANATSSGRVTAVNKTRVQLAREEGQEQGLEKGRQEGRQEGQLSAFRAAITELLEARFGPVPADMREWVSGIEDADELRRILLAAGTSTSVDAFRATLAH